MITFKDFLIENQNYPLYHATDVHSLIGILKADSLYAGYTRPEEHWPSKSGRLVSLTRNLPFAVNWAHMDGGYPAIIQLNRGKLRNRYKITPFNFFSDKTRRISTKRWDFPHYDNMTPKQKAMQGVTDLNQYEEAIDRDIKPVIQYIDKIILNRNSDVEFRDSKPELYNKVSRFIEVSNRL